MSTNYSPHMTVMIKAATKAARGIIRDFGEVEHLQVSRKGTADFVTQTDMRAEKALHEVLSQARPEYGFLLEESGEIKGKPGCPYRFIIDPLDGTINFMHGMPLFCISIGLEKRDESGSSEIEAALTLCPATRELFWAEKGRGAWMESDGRRATRLRVSSRRKLEDSMFIVGSLKRVKAERLDEVQNISQVSAGIRVLGSTALALAYTAAGRADGFYQHDACAWDIAAGILLVKEAGGVVSDVHGKNAMLQNGSIVVANSDLHPSFLSLVKSK